MVDAPEVDGFAQAIRDAVEAGVQFEWVHTPSSALLVIEGSGPTRPASIHRVPEDRVAEFAKLLMASGIMPLRQPRRPFRKRSKRRG